ncbi:hypothetical protein [Vibrio sp. ER1A]|uniref:hypothetical protein n=1 Tax=Vibrio sp. ER1A TaxID=1517681 RepID=UPI0004DD81CC|nr:hypothetical protein [Vibrio sp. ER1A]KFA99293.1 hypothetical protein HW45_04625 [Vibrio sp. ER1A]
MKNLIIVFLFSLALAGCNSEDGSGDVHCSVYSNIDWFESGDNYLYKFNHNECNWTTEAVTNKQGELLSITVGGVNSDRVTEFVSDELTTVTTYNKSGVKLTEFRVFASLDYIEKITYQNGQVYLNETYAFGTPTYQQAKDESDKKMYTNGWKRAIAWATINQKF